MKNRRLILVILSLVILPAIAFSQGNPDHALADVELDYTYADGGRVILTLDDGSLGYRWTAGPFAGTEVTGLDYYSKEITDSVYFVSWHDPGNQNFVTLIFDLERMVEHGTALLAYETDNESTLFDEAKINSVKRL